RRNDIVYRHARLWSGARIAVYVFRFCPKPDGQPPKIWRMAQYGKSRFWLCRTRPGVQIPVECRFGLAAAFAGARSVPRDLDCYFRGDVVVFAWENQLATRQSFDAYFGWTTDDGP